MTTKNVYHLALNSDQTAGIRTAFLPGDPNRVEKIGKTFKSSQLIASKREFVTCEAVADDDSRVLVTSTGVGGPSTSIVVDELAQLGLQNFIRIGTTGAIQPHIQVGDVIISQGAVRLDGSSPHIAPMEYPAVADFYITQALVRSAQELGIPFHVGISVTSATFYQGQERYDSYSGYVPNHLRESYRQWQSLKALNYEMECATLFVMAQAFGLRAGCVTGVLLNRTVTEQVDTQIIPMVEERVIKVAVNALKYLLGIT